MFDKLMAFGAGFAACGILVIATLFIDIVLEHLANKASADDKKY